MDTREDLLARAREIADWYEDKDLLFDDYGRPYVNVEYEDDECNVTVKRSYLDN